MPSSGMKRRPVSTVQPLGLKERVVREGMVDYEFTRGMIRFRGKWVLEVFPLGTKVIATREYRKDKIDKMTSNSPLPFP